MATYEPVKASVFKALREKAETMSDTETKELRTKAAKLARLFQDAAHEKHSAREIVAGIESALGTAASIIGAIA